MVQLVMMSLYAENKILSIIICRRSHSNEIKLKIKDNEVNC